MYGSTTIGHTLAASCTQVGSMSSRSDQPDSESPRTANDNAFDRAGPPWSESTLESCMNPGGTSATTLPDLSTNQIPPPIATGLTPLLNASGNVNDRGAAVDRS